jgi:hypothetical protein
VTVRSGDPQKAREAISKLQIAEAAVRAGSGAQVNARLSALPIPDGYGFVPGIQSLAVSTTSQAYPFRWPIDGVCIGVFCSIRGAAITSQDTYFRAMLNLTLRVTISGGESAELVSDGDAGVGGAFSGFSSMNGQFYCPLWRPVARNEVWNAIIANAADGLAAIPVIQYAFLRNAG